jgi:hypothetical protein
MENERLFDELDINGRADLLWEKGELITIIDYYNQKVELYLIESFYAELYYDPSLNKIVSIEKCSTLSLNKFLKSIQIDSPLS